VIAAKAKYTVFVQKIIITVTTDAAQTFTAQDTNGTPKVIAEAAANPGEGQLIFEWGDEGEPLTEGKGLDFVQSAAGLGYNYDVYAYRRATSTLIPSEL